MFRLFERREASMSCHDAPTHKKRVPLLQGGLLGLILFCLAPFAAECAEPLRVVGNADNPPLAFLSEEGFPSGYDVDVITLLAQVAGLSISLDLLPRAEAQRRFQEGSAELLLGRNITPDREALFDFTPPHFENHLVIFASPSFSFEGLEDLFGRRVGVTQNTLEEELMRERHPAAQLWTFRSQPQAMEALLQGQVDAVLGSAAVGRWWILEKNAFSKIAMVGNPLHRTPYAMALQKGNEELLQRLSSGLMHLQKRGDLQRLREIWLEPQGGISHIRHPQILGFLLGGGALLLLALGATLFMSWRIRAITRAERALNKRLRQEMEERRNAEKQLRNNEIFLSSIVEHIPSGIFVKNLATNTYILTNRGTEEIFGIPRHGILQKTPQEVFGEEQSRLFEEQDAEALERNEAVRHEDFQLTTAHGEVRWFSCVKVPLGLIENKQTHILEIIDDITERKEIQDRLRWASFHDGLTQIYNRSYFQEEMARLSSGRFDTVGIIICDVDGMKLINDTLGHATGDEVLKITARILRQTFRKEDVVARIGGDEFAVLLPNVTYLLLEERRKQIQEFLDQENQEREDFPLFLSIGIALRNSPEMTMEELFHRADENMYDQKLRYREFRKKTLVAHFLAKGITPPPEHPKVGEIFPPKG
jgi:diguanylate cyclase (GGDEF)-like protein/PAS domain S-box-containing protein